MSTESDLVVRTVDLHSMLVAVEENNSRSPEVGTQVIFTFTNGWKASVIQGLFTYGGAQGLFEMAVFDPSGEINYANPVCPDGVDGWLTADAVVDKLRVLAFLTNEELQRFAAESDNEGTDE
jgi:hypothetical protein